MRASLDADCIFLKHLFPSARSESRVPAEGRCRTRTVAGGCWLHYQTIICPTLRKRGWQANVQLQSLSTSPPRRPKASRICASCTQSSVAPKAEETIKWGTPFFVEPRFVFAFSAHKAHLNFSATPAGLEPFRKELEKHTTT